MSTNWNNLRSFKNSQNNAFEELCCQLAEYEVPPPGSKFVRKGTPDGGVECFWTLPSGNQWGWQAKFLAPQFTPAQWRQLDESVATALRVHPKLTRYTICLPFDRSDPKGRKGHKSFLDQWNARVKKWEKDATRAGRTIEFIYWGDHEIHERLSKEEHAGRYRFWFDKELFSESWFRGHISEAIANAGTRYSPAINVNLPIRQIFEGLGRTPEFFGRIDTLHKNIRKWYERLPMKTLSEVLPKFSDELRHRMADLLKTLEQIRTNDWSLLPFKDLGAIELKTTQQCIDLLVEQRNVRRTGTSTIPGRGELTTDFRNELYELRQLRESLQELRLFAVGARGITSNNPALLIVGGAGSGKTHLLCDIAANRISNGHPTVILLGEQFGTSEPWKQILELLKLSCTRDEFLGALDAAAMASGVRALILLDALNEGEGYKIWPKHLAGMLTHLENFPRIGIALTVRDSYEQLIIPPKLTSENKLLREEHQGFREHEYEAASRFFAYFGLEPSVPLLYPDFGNPQFLLLFCKALHNQGLSRIPPGLQGITSIFDFYLNSINDKLARAEYLGYDAADTLVQKATQKITKYMADHGRRWLSREGAKKIIDSLLPGREYERSLFRHLLAEGVFAEDFFYSGKKRNPDRILRFSYERFADHQIAQRMLDAHLDKRRPQRCFASRRPLGRLFANQHASWQNRGLIEALSVQVPERTGKELPNLLPRSLIKNPAIRAAFVESLLWRRRDAFGSATLRIINDSVVRYSDSREQFWNLLLTVAPVPGHPLNAEFLHRNLARHSMSDRDAWWTKFIHEQYRHQSSVDRILDWAWSPLRTLDLELNAASLCATAITWLFTASNRFLRDHATKTLSKIVDGRTDILLSLIPRFQSVDDPYVIERVCAVAYSCSMRTSDLDGLTKLAELIYGWIFAKKDPPLHILIRDYARGVIEAALHSGANLKIDLPKVRPPYRSVWPKVIPSKDELKVKYGWREEKMADTEWPRLSIYESVMGFGDFARYVIGTNSGSFHWSNRKLGEKPKPTMKEKYEKFLAHLSRTQKEAWDRLEEHRQEQLYAKFSSLTGSKQDLNLQKIERNVEKSEESFRATLGTAQVRAYRTDVVGYRKRSHTADDQFDLLIAQRWILNRVFELGWTTERFGEFDRNLNAHSWTREARKSERIGKKYQWIAYHEFLGLVSDNFEFKDPIFSEGPEKYKGPWQTYTRDIDPSCLLRKTPGGDKGDDCWWLPNSTYVHDAEIDSARWICSTDDLPRPEDLISISNPENGSEWFLLEGYPAWNETVPNFEDEFGVPRKHLWYQLRSILVERKYSARVFKWMSKQHFWGRWMPETPDHHKTFLGEFYWAQSLEGNEEYCDPTSDKYSSKLSDLQHPFVLTSGAYNSEMNSFDCSNEEHFKIFLPGAWLSSKMGLKWKGIDGSFFDSSGNLIAFDPAVSSPGSHALLIDRNALLSFLRKEEYDVIWFLLAGKQVYGGMRSDPEEWLGELQISGAYRFEGDRVTGSLKTKFIKPPRLTKKLQKRTANLPRRTQ